MKYIKGIIGEKSTTTRNTKGSSSKAKASEGMVLELTEESKMNKKAEEGKLTDWSKFKKVEMSVFNGTNLDLWLFRAD